MYCFKAVYHGATLKCVLLKAVYHGATLKPVLESRCYDRHDGATFITVTLLYRRYGFIKKNLTLDVVTLQGVFLQNQNFMKVINQKVKNTCNKSSQRVGELYKKIKNLFYLIQAHIIQKSHLKKKHSDLCCTVTTIEQYFGCLVGLLLSLKADKTSS